MKLLFASSAQNCPQKRLLHDPTFDRWPERHSKPKEMLNYYPDFQHVRSVAVIRFLTSCSSSSSSASRRSALVIAGDTAEGALGTYGSDPARSCGAPLSSSLLCGVSPTTMRLRVVPIDLSQHLRYPQTKFQNFDNLPAHRCAISENC